MTILNKFILSKIHEKRSWLEKRGVADYKNLWTEHKYKILICKTFWAYLAFVLYLNEFQRWELFPKVYEHPNIECVWTCLNVFESVSMLFIFVCQKKPLKTCNAIINLNAFFTAPPNDKHRCGKGQYKILKELKDI